MATKFIKFIIYFLDLVEVKLMLRTESGEMSMEDIVTRKRATFFTEAINIKQTGKIHIA
jgi:hypothetical protein